MIPDIRALRSIHEHWQGNVGGLNAQARVITTGAEDVAQSRISWRNVCDRTKGERRYPILSYVMGREGGLVMAGKVFS